MSVLTHVVDWVAAPYSLYLVLVDRDIPVAVKLRALAVLAGAFFYVLSPLDIIPDIHPLLGWVDDLVVVPLIFSLADRVVPEIDLKEIRARAHSGARLTVFWVALGIILIAAVALLLLALLAILAVRLIRG